MITTVEKVELLNDYCTQISWGFAIYKMFFNYSGA